MNYRLFIVKHEPDYSTILLSHRPNPEWLVAEWQPKLERWYELNRHDNFCEAYAKLLDYLILELKWRT